MLSFPDIDECATLNQTCHSQAYCNNTAGSFLCICKAGYSGDGMMCSGESNRVEKHE